jgi:hypothetical protein
MLKVSKGFSTGAALAALQRLIPALTPKDKDGRFEYSRDFSSRLALFIARLYFARLREFASARTLTCSRVIVSANKHITVKKLKLHNKNNLFIQLPQMKLFIPESVDGIKTGGF